MDEVKNLETLEATEHMEDTSQVEEATEKVEKKSFLKNLFSSKDSKEEKPQAEEAKPAEDFEARLKTEKAKWLKELEEQSKFDALPEEEKARAREKEKDDKIKALEETILKNNLKSKATEALENEGLPTKLASVLDFSSEENMKASLENVTAVFKELVKEAVDHRLKGKTPEGLGNAAQRENMLNDEIAEAIKGGF